MYAHRISTFKLRLLTRLNASAARLFEDLMLENLWRSPCLTAYWGIFISHKHFSLSDEVTQPSTTGARDLYGGRSCVLEEVAERPTLHPRWKHHQCLCKWRQSTCSGVTGGTEAAWRRHIRLLSRDLLLVFPCWGVWPWLLCVIICVFSLAFSPSAGILSFSPGLANTSIFNDVHTNPSELFKCHFIHLQPNSSIIHRLP